MTLLLLSAGEILDGPIGQALASLVNDPRHSKLAFITTAAEVEPEAVSFIERDRAALKELGFDVIDFDIKNQAEYSKLDDCEVIFIEGGNTFYLLDVMRKNQFDKKLKQLLKKGIIYVGVSAGSIVAGPNIEISKFGDKNLHGVKDFTGLKLVPFCITPHFDQDMASGKAEAILHEAWEKEMPLVALNDNQGLLLKDGKFQVVGSGELCLWNLPKGLWEFKIKI